jgi:superoxide dismutase
MLFFISLDKANRLDVGNAVNPRPSDEDKKLVIVKSPNAVNPLVWDYSVSILMDYDLPNSPSLLHLLIFVDFLQPLLTIDVWEVLIIFTLCS